MDAARFGPELSDADKARLLDEIAEHFPLLINVQDVAQERFVYVSAAWEELTGLPVERWLEDPTAWVHMIHPEDREYTLQLSEDGRQQNAVARDIRILHRDGSVHWLHGWLTPILNAEGVPLRVIGVAEDNTARKEVELSLRARQVDLEQTLRRKELELHRTQEELSRLRSRVGESTKEVDATRQAHATLTPREREVFDQVVSGATGPAIAKALGIADATVKVHRRRILQKLDAANIPILVAKAVRANLMG